MIEDLLRRYNDAAGAGLAGREIEALVKFAEMIAKWNRIANLVGSSSAPELVNNHLVDCLAAVPFIDGSRIVDVGSGAGLPGIVVAILRPQAEITLVEAHQRKSRFLHQVAIELDLGNVTVAANRIESWRPAAAVDCVVCRGYSSLAKFFDDTRALHHAGCRLIAMKGAVPEAEIAALDLDERALSVRALDVPGWSQRHLVTIDCG